MKLNKGIWKDEEEFWDSMKIYLSTKKRKYKFCTLRMGNAKWASLSATYNANKEFIKLKLWEVKQDTSYIQPINIIEKNYVVDWKVIHKLYMKSNVWKNKRLEFFKKANNRCECCKLEHSSWALNLHHHTYSRIWYEKETDLAVVCINCHHKIHFDNWTPVALDEKILRARYEMVKTKF